MCGGVAKPGSPTARLIAPGTRGVMSNMRRMSDTGTARARPLTQSVVLPIGASLDAWVASGPGDDRDLDQVVRGREPGLDGGPGRRVGLVEPRIPGGVHAVVVADVRDPHVRPHDLRLVATEVRQGLVDLPQDLPRLTLGVELRVVGDGPRDVDGVPVLGGGGDAGPDLVARDAHRWLLLPERGLGV